jgi:hypothetical protein
VAETPYAETEALLAVMNNDTTRLNEILAGCTFNELCAFHGAALSLADAVHRAFIERK